MQAHTFAKHFDINRPESFELLLEIAALNPNIRSEIPKLKTSISIQNYDDVEVTLNILSLRKLFPPIVETKHAIQQLELYNEVEG